MKRKKLWILLGGLVVLLGGGLGIAGMQDKGLAVQVATVGRENLQAKVSANGKIQAVTKADISANVMGQVTKLAVKEGDLVHKGQFLMEIDPAVPAPRPMPCRPASMPPFGPGLGHGQRHTDPGRLRAAKMNREAGIISTADFEHAKTAYDTAVAAEESFRRRADQAKANVNQSHVGLGFPPSRPHGWRGDRPPDRVGRDRRARHPEPGRHRLLTISDMSKVEAEMEVDEASIPTVKLARRPRCASMPIRTRPSMVKSPKWAGAPS